MALLDQGEDVADELVRRHLDRLLDQAVDVVFHRRNLRELLALGHIVMDQAEAAVERHGDGHARLGDRVHVRGDDRNLEVEMLRQRGLEVGVPGEDFGILRRQGDVVISKGDALLRGEKGVRGLVKSVVDGAGRRGVCCHGLSWEANVRVASRSCAREGRCRWERMGVMGDDGSYAA